MAFGTGEARHARDCHGALYSVAWDTGPGDIAAASRKPYYLIYFEPSSEKEAMFGRPPYLTKFDRWLETGDVRPVVENFDMDQFLLRNNAIPRPDAEANFVANIRQRLGEDAQFNITLDAGMTFDLARPPDGQGSIHSLTIRNNQLGGTLHGLRIRNCTINFQHGPKEILFRDCWIDTISLSRVQNLRLANCFIGTLTCHQYVGDIAVLGGCVLRVTTPSAGGENPFTGSVYFDTRVYLPATPGGRLIDAQPYRNMRAHMMKLENGPMISRFHVLELAVERKQEPYGFARLVSFAYGMVSSYGGSITRPSCIWLGLMVLTCAILYFGDAVSVRPETHDWMAGLVRTSHWRAFERAGLQTLQGTFNPLGIFGTQNIGSAKYGWTTAWMFFHGVTSATLAALFVLALRRRFKMS